MRLIGNREAVEWLGHREIHLTESEYPVAYGASHSVEVSISPDTITGLTYMICEMEQPNFQGGLLVLREWNIGSPELDRIAHTAISLMLNNSPLDPSNPLYLLFDPSEWLTLQPFFLQPLLYHWDAFYVPAASSLLVFVSHDEVIYFVSIKSAMSDQLLKSFKRWGAKRITTPSFLSVAI
jgi:hypothetical protein